MEKSSERKLGEILLSAGMINIKNLEDALAKVDQVTNSLGEVLVTMGAVSEEQIMYALSIQYGVPFVELDNYPIDPTVINCLPEAFARRYEVIAVGESSDGVLIATCKAVDERLQQFIRNFLGSKIRFAFCLKAEIIEAIDTLYPDNVFCTWQDEEISEEGEMIFGDSPIMKKLFETLVLYAKNRETVLIEGETGTGKELVAKNIHLNSERKSKPFVAINCTALPDTLLESELFGYERGAFTGAYTRKLGRFDMAKGGTLFLDEIGDINPSLQAKLLRVLQERSFERLGGTATIDADVRIVTATNRDLEGLARVGKYRDDLFYRLNVLSLRLPPLRERKEDIPLLIKHFIKKFAGEYDKRQKYVSPKVLDFFYNYDWPGNIRELENVIRRAMVLAEGDSIHLNHLPDKILKLESMSFKAPVESDGNEADIQKIEIPKENYSQIMSEPIFSLDEVKWKVIGNKTLREAKNYFEKKVIQDCLDQYDFNKSKVADLLGISRKGLKDKINRYEIESNKVN